MAMTGALAISGNSRLTERIREAAKREALGQASILSGPGDLVEAARFLAAAMECEGQEKPCGACGACRKVLRNIHPDVVTVTDPEHKNVSVEVLRDTVADAYILPNEGRRKIYIFPDCTLLDPKAQNVLLKVLEEGPPHGAFLFCAKNSAVLLPTIRSRAVEWKLANVEEDPAADGRAGKLCGILREGRTADMAAFCAELESSKTSREELRTLLSDARDMVAAALAASYTGEGGKEEKGLAEALGRQGLSRCADVLERFIRQCGYNVGVGHLAGALGVELMELQRLRQEQAARFVPCGPKSRKETLGFV